MLEKQNCTGVQLKHNKPNILGVAREKFILVV